MIDSINSINYINSHISEKATYPSIRTLDDRKPKVKTLKYNFNPRTEAWVSYDGLYKTKKSTHKTVEYVRKQDKDSV